MLCHIYRKKRAEDQSGGRSDPIPRRRGHFGQSGLSPIPAVQTLNPKTGLFATRRHKETRIIVEK